jgi:hypothetical protein
MFLRIYVAVLSLVVVVLATAAFRQAGKPQNLGKITVERINVVDANGTLRLVISNKDRMHPGVIDGKTMNRPRPEAGLLFFNDQGDEIGGLTYSGREANGSRNAATHLNFDQLKQDQTIGFMYNESNGQKSAGFQVWDPPDARLSDFIEKFNAAMATPDPARRDTAIEALRATMPPRPRRVYVGKTAAREAIVSLADANGKPRLTLTVEANGNARIEFLDENGKVTSRYPQVQ